MTTTNTKPWGGRFEAPTDQLVERFNASLDFDKRLIREDILGSQAHVQMLASTGILSQEEADTILHGLSLVTAEVESGSFPWRIEFEDVHMNVEVRLKELIGPVAGKLHTARSRNDQVATDFRLYLKQTIQEVIQLLKNLRTAIVGEAERNFGIIMPGYTHLQVGQPILVSHWFLAYFEMLSRDQQRFEDALVRVNQNPLGSGALAGTPWPIDRLLTTEQLGFSIPSANSLDGVGSRDAALEFLSSCAILMSTISRISEEFVLFSSFEFGFITLPDAYTTGSSIMPQKKNADVCELARGKAGRVFGDLMGLLTVVKGTPLAYNKDFQEDKEPVFDAADTVTIILKLYAAMLPKVAWHGEVCRYAAARGYSTATDLADYLARRGVPFRESHEVVGKLVAHCVTHHIQLWELSHEILSNAHPLLGEDALAAVTVEASVNSRVSLGGTAPQRVQEAIVAAKQRL
jgi:argininosuccinate lyase